MADLTLQHDRHDLELVAMHAAADASPDEARRAQALIDACSECAALAGDLRDIASAVKTLSPAASSTVRASRDFRLTPEQAARLRPAGLLARLGGGLFGGLVAFGRPVGAALATFGLVGLLVSSVSLTPMGGAASVPATAPEAATGQAPGFGAAGLQPAETATSDRNATRPLATGSSELAGTGPKAADEGQVGAGALPWLFGGSIVLLALGVLLLLAGARGRASARSSGP